MNQLVLLEVCTPYVKLNKCKLERVGSLDFPHRYGGCANVNDDSIYLCFSKEDSDLKRCRKGRNPLGSFEQISNSNFEHNNTRIAANEGKLVVQKLESYFQTLFWQLEAVAVLITEKSNLIG